MKRTNVSSGLCQFSLKLVVILVIVCVSLTSGSTYRCFSPCRRSEDDFGCRRCRFREPLRFGKRSEIESNSEYTFFPKQKTRKYLQIPLLFRSPKYIYNVPFYGNKW
ncbi:hypothetical protein B4U80_01653 [Leptotrombidium deliense]|uniref:Uncharacterized protein n=1 Tax=Leptotrombidium deliense TaxID=299467 RepID=A0A443SVP3_9ACAR|nr:hypothetical protein B4U80_01653 [Leptotrombidium deliense]